MRMLTFVLIIFVQATAAYANFGDQLSDALQDNDLNRAEALLNTVSKGAKPLVGTEDQGGVLLVIWSLLREITSAAQIDRLTKISLRLIEVGADLSVPVEFGGEKKYPYDGFPLSPVEIALHEWVAHSKLPPTKETLEYIKASKIFFEILLSNNLLDPNYLLILPTQGIEHRKMSILQWLSARDASPDIKDFFMRRQFGIDTLDNIDWNLAMVAAMKGDLDLLKSIVNTCSAQATTQMFNYRCAFMFNPTVLHVAVGSAAYTGADRAIEMVKLLTKHGADPDQRSKLHSLFDEVDFWSRIHPDKKSEYQKVRRYLEAHWQNLRDDYRKCVKELEP